MVKFLTLAHLMAEVASLSPEYLDLSDEFLYDANLLEKLVNEVLLSENAEESYSTSILIENQIEQRASEYIENLLTDIPTYDNLAILYEQTIENYTPETEYSASHTYL